MLEVRGVKEVAIDVWDVIDAVALVVEDVGVLAAVVGTK